ncbi:uncharacterized protein LOC117100468 [Anneissia japonica]|uniref:uncharacterized protein LOC117100468 n=1 Tax=Anneissia japonica TaxID=1529436 RepID=UPI00142552B7|nr:uncharacterized protein LOC117100468 [Anneissia japonica]
MIYLRSWIVSFLSSYAAVCCKASIGLMGSSQVCPDVHGKIMDPGNSARATENRIVIDLSSPLPCRGFIKGWKWFNVQSGVFTATVWRRQLMLVGEVIQYELVGRTHINSTIAVGMTDSLHLPKSEWIPFEVGDMIGLSFDKPPVSVTPDATINAAYLMNPNLMSSNDVKVGSLLPLASTENEFYSLQAIIEVGTPGIFTTPVIATQGPVSGWVTVLKCTVGTGIDVRQAWLNGTGISDDNAFMSMDTKQNYRNHAVLKSWSSLFIPSAKLSFYDESQNLVAFIWCSANGYTMTTWFWQNLFIGSSWIDISPAYSFSNFGFNGYNERLFYVGRSDECDTGAGWIMVVNGQTNTSCQWESAESYPLFLYSSDKTSVEWATGNVGHATFMIIEVNVVPS